MANFPNSNPEAHKWFRTALMKWASDNRMNYPWRDRPTPYSVWIAEVMLQQTVVTSVIPHFKSWMARFPDIHKLANATEREVLRQWEGLGYYSRARNIRKAAKIIIEDYGGKLPKDYDELIRLPGIGKYTAAAIASIAFGASTPVLDANVRRVMARYLGGSPKDDIILGFLSKAISSAKPGVFNEALMELGQTICRPKKTLCTSCPLRKGCLWPNADARPELSKRAATERISRKSIATVMVHRGRLLLQRNQEGLFAGLFTLPRIGATKSTAEVALARLMDSIGIASFRIESKLTNRIHHYTSYAEQLLPYNVTIVRPSQLTDPLLVWVPTKEIENYPLPSVYRRIVREYLEIGD